MLINKKTALHKCKTRTCAHAHTQTHTHTYVSLVIKRDNAKASK